MSESICNCVDPKTMQDCYPLCPFIILDLYLNDVEISESVDEFVSDLLNKKSSLIVTFLSDYFEFRRLVKDGNLELNVQRLFNFKDILCSWQDFKGVVLDATSFHHLSLPIMTLIAQNVSNAYCVNPEYLLFSICGKKFNCGTVSKIHQNCGIILESMDDESLIKGCFICLDCINQDAEQVCDMPYIELNEEDLIRISESMRLTNDQKEICGCVRKEDTVSEICISFSDLEIKSSNFDRQLIVLD